MTWTILIFVVGILLFLFGGVMLSKGDGKKPSTKSIIMVKSIKLISIILISGSICRLYVPYYLTAVNPVIVQ